MTSEENLRVTQRLFDRWNAGDRGVDEEITDPEIELHTPLAATRRRSREGSEPVEIRR